MWYELCGPNMPTGHAHVAHLGKTSTELRPAHASPDELNAACRGVVACGTLRRGQYEAVVNRPGHAAYLGGRRQYAVYAQYTEVIKKAGF